MKENELKRQELKGTNSCRQAKHAKLYSDLLKALGGRAFESDGDSLQRRL